MAVLNKPGRDVTLPGSYRPISLLNSVTKIYERILAARLQYAGARGALHARHFGSIPNRSAEDALAYIMQRCIETSQAKECSAITGVDVKGAHTNAQHAYLTKSLQRGLDKVAARCGPQPGLLAACTDWLRNLTIQLTFHSTTGEDPTGREWTSLDSCIGIPQGSPLSPVLWLYCINPLLDTISRTWPLEQAAPVSYADDLDVVVFGHTAQILADRVRQINAVIRAWAKEACVGLDKAFLLPMGQQSRGAPTDHDLTPLCTVGLASDREGAPPTPNYATSAKILGVTLRYDHKPCDTLSTRTTDIYHRHRTPVPPHLGPHLHKDQRRQRHPVSPP